MKIPAAERPVPHYVEGYGVPESVEGTVSWSFVAERMEAARNYWVVTINPNGRPHARPVWGVWHDNKVHFGGGPDTRWSRNLQRYPYVTVHVESTEEVVIIEGRATVTDDGDSPFIALLDGIYERKYDMRHGPPIWTLHPHKVFAWRDMPSLTRWVFQDDATQ